MASSLKSFNHCKVEQYTVQSLISNFQIGIGCMDITFHPLKSLGIK